MPILTVISQPDANSLNAAYRPVIIRVKATRTDGNPIPPVVYCDVYFNGVYYKTHSKTQYNSLNAADSEWEFDVQDSAQEYLKKFLAVNGGSQLIDAVPIIAKIQCKFRSSGYDVNGFVTPEGLTPIQGTSDSDPVSGTGISFNQFFVINIALQHEDNQDLATHLTSYKQRTWQADIYPLTHRPDHYFIGIDQSDYFPIVDKQDRCYTHLVLFYRNKNQSTLNSTEISLPAPSCESAVTSITAIQVGTNAVVDWNYSGLPKDFRYRIDGGAWTVVTNNSATISGLSFADHTIEVEPRCLCSSGTSLTKNFTLSDPSFCEPVSYGTLFLPNAFKDLPYNFFITLSGTAPFELTVNSKPAWMNISISGNKVYFSGTPPTATVQPDIDIDISNCSAASSINLTGTIGVTDTSSVPCRAYSIHNDGVGMGATVEWTDCTGSYRNQFLSLYATIEVCALEVYAQTGIVVNLITPNYC